MNIALPAAALIAALTMGGSFPVVAHMGGMGSGSASASGHATMGGHGFGFHGFGRHGFVGFHQPDFRFGDFASHRITVFTGGPGDYDYANEDDSGPYEDDIDNLHFRVQEPFGPGDIGRPPVRAEEDAPYLSDRGAPWHGYEPQDW